MDTGLSLYPLRLTLTATEPISLDAHPGSALRGAIFNALLRRFCANPTAPSCAACPLNATCPVAGLVAPFRDENPRGRDIPRPFVLAADWTPTTPTTPTTNVPASAQRFAPGDTLPFRITLMGRAIAFFPYLALATQLMELNGIGRPLPENHGRRGRFEVDRIELMNPFTEKLNNANATPDAHDTSDTADPQLLYQRGQSRVATPTLAITAGHIADRAASLSPNTLTLRFLTPTRLVDRGQLVRHPALRILCARLAERLDALTREYSDSAAPRNQNEAQDVAAAHASRERALRLAEHAARIRVTENATRWVDVASYSARQQRSTPIGGLIGHATYTGDLTPLRELLVWGELLHVGKNAVKGDGRYRIESSPAAIDSPSLPADPSS